MAGPTPISALIHAATMVAAGVYVVARLYPVFLVTPAALWILAIAAALTAVTAALSAFAQRDLKRILAYSTVSQLALMVAALAAGGRDAAVFHLMSHGGFKALLFLGAGVIIHKAGTGDVDELSAHHLRRKLPVTCVTMTIGLAALAGFPPFSGFFSKESIAGAAYDTATHSGPTNSLLGITPPAGIGWLVLVATLLTGFLTAAYALRTWWMLFGPLERGWFRPTAEASQEQPKAPERAGEWALEALVAESIREETEAAEQATAKAKTRPRGTTRRDPPAGRPRGGYHGVRLCRPERRLVREVARRRRRQRLPRLGGQCRQAHPARRRLPPGPRAPVDGPGPDRPGARRRAGPGCGPRQARHRPEPRASDSSASPPSSASAPTTSRTRSPSARSRAPRMPSDSSTPRSWTPTCGGAAPRPGCSARACAGCRPATSSST